VVAPVEVSGRLWGAVGATVKDGPFEDELPSALRRLAELVTMTIATHLEREEIVVETASRIFGGSLDVENTLGAIADAARRALGADRATCYIHSSDQATIEAVYTTEADPEQRALLEGAVGRGRRQLPLWGLLIDSESPFLVIEDLGRCDGIPPKVAGRLGSGALAGARIEHPTPGPDGRSVLLGSLFVSYRAPRSFSARDERIGRALGGLAALALTNAQLHSTTLDSLASAESRAATDPVTGLSNHRAFQERLTTEYAHARKSHGDLALVLLDIDHFKRVNDAHGHIAGDDVLAELAERLAAGCRSEDLVARIGGEEFAVIMPGVDGPTAWDVAERLRFSVSSRPFGDIGKVTVSAGICTVRQATSVEELKRFAGGALYWAKSKGRDSAYLFSPDVVQVLSDGERADRLARSQALQSIRVLAKAVDAKDHSTREHSERVADLSVQIAIALGWPIESAARLRESGLLHDVGKIGIPDAVLLKPGPLTDEEFALVKTHAALGAQMASEVLEEDQVAWIRGHHERHDGRGYPDGLAGEAIPEGARILALADSWDVMTSIRSYSTAWSLEEALLECRAESGGQFWPPAVDALSALHQAGALLAQMDARQHPAGAEPSRRASRSS
jgi:diguanylate cyclase (GGDEF)-like protein